MPKPLRMGWKLHERKVRDYGLVLAGCAGRLERLMDQVHRVEAEQVEAARMLLNIETAFSDNQRECDASGVGFADWQVSEPEGVPNG